MASPTVVQVAPTTLSLSTVGQSQSVTVSDAGYGGTFVVSGCSGIVTTSGPSSGALLVTAAAAGTCTLTVADANDSTATIAITVSTLSVPVQ
jgi:hypothetical protein